MPDSVKAAQWRGGDLASAVGFSRTSAPPGTTFELAAPLLGQGRDLAGVAVNLQLGAPQRFQGRELLLPQVGVEEPHQGGGGLVGDLPQGRDHVARPRQVKGALQAEGPFAAGDIADPGIAGAQHRQVQPAEIEVDQGFAGEDAAMRCRASIASGKDQSGHGQGAVGGPADALAAIDFLELLLIQLKRGAKAGIGKEAVRGQMDVPAPG